LRFVRVLLAVVSEAVQFGGVRQPRLLLLGFDVWQGVSHVGCAGGRDVVDRLRRQVRCVVGLHARSDGRRATGVRRPVARQRVERVGRRLVDVHLVTELGRQAPALVRH